VIQETKSASVRYKTRIRWFVL